VVAGLAVLASAGSASAATLKVTKTSDPVPGACTANDCSLREAVRRANSTAADDRIVLKAKTYGLEQSNFDDDATAGDLDVVSGSGRLTIAGKGSGKTTIDGNGVVESILQTLAGARLTVTELTLTDGGLSGAGGALSNRGNSSLQRVAMRANSGGLVGGAIYNAGAGSLQISRSVIADNEAGGGGAIWSENEGNVTITRSRLIGNRALDFGGGAIYNQDESRMTIRRSRIGGNTATESGLDGGGIYNQNQARLKIARSTIVGNRADDDGGGIYNSNEARLTIGRTTISSNRTLDTSGSTSARGGGIFHQNEAVLRVSNSTISGNTSPTNGGGLFIQNDTAATLINTTVSGNAADQGGGIYANNWPYIRISFSTIAQNSAETTGGAIFAQTQANNLLRPPPFWLLRGTIVAKNSSPGADNCALHEDSDPNHFDSQGSNLEDDNTCFFNRGSDQRNANARLRKLAKNGGTTKTHALKPSSDAVDAAKKKGCPKRDQRRVKRPQGNRCDIGSYELKQR
jgi:CSLREA domain-containing protein